MWCTVHACGAQLQTCVHERVLTEVPGLLSFLEVVGDEPEFLVLLADQGRRPEE